METQTPTIKTEKEIDPQPPIWVKRISWLVVIWSLSVLSLGAVAYGIRKFMMAAGMTT